MPPTCACIAHSMTQFVPATPTCLLMPMTPPACPAFSPYLPAALLTSLRLADSVGRQQHLLTEPLVPRIAFRKAFRHSAPAPPRHSPPPLHPFHPSLPSFHPFHPSLPPFLHPSLPIPPLPPSLSRHTPTPLGPSTDIPRSPPRPTLSLTLTHSLRSLRRAPEQGRNRRVVLQHMVAPVGPGAPPQPEPCTIPAVSVCSSLFSSPSLVSSLSA